MGGILNNLRAFVWLALRFEDMFEMPTAVFLVQQMHGP
jgi:hypothetical protein